MVNKHKQKKKRIFKSNGKSNKDLNALRNFTKSSKNEKDEDMEGATALPRNVIFRQ